MKKNEPENPKNPQRQQQPEKPPHQTTYRQNSRIHSRKNRKKKPATTRRSANRHKKKKMPGHVPLTIKHKRRNNPSKQKTQTDIKQNTRPHMNTYYHPWKEHRPTRNSGRSQSRIKLRVYKQSEIPLGLYPNSKKINAAKETRFCGFLIVTPIVSNKAGRPGNHSYLYKYTDCNGTAPRKIAVAKRGPTSR